MVVSASDFQEAKNVDSVGSEIMPNTSFKRVRVTGVTGPALTWLTPAENQCVGKTAGLIVVASSSKRLRSVRFFADGKQVAVDRKGTADLYNGSWKRGSAPKGRHVLRAVATDASGHTLAATRHVRICR